MGYVLGQFSKNKSSSNEGYMTYITQGIVSRKQTGTDSGVSGSSDLFDNECVQIPSILKNNTNYYFHGKIKRMTSEQVFYIKLINFTAVSQEDEYEPLFDIEYGLGIDH